ncbi:hypothetical protein SAMN04487995_0992 [Dyadobacter koreensis]|uniref:Lipoprotein n=1 Tax=Dyadobacter koreensis TaxID=408657 RepID=A0A1H6RG99_9BACT|nr:hypothetical protein [Dyadobacter koreensis]SEI50212.1 hypothetical protein SAMN04487995_0992 [Dyadobacter koreensis]
MTYSITLRNILVLILLAVAFQNCKTKTKDEQEATVTDSASLTKPAPEELNSDQSALLQEILGTSTEGVFRGITFGDPLSKVKATETYEMFEDAADHVGFTKETEKLETIDIQYFITTDKKVNKIMIDVYLNSPDATKQLWNAAKGHFTELYEAPKEKDKTISWFKNSVHVTMEDVSEGKDYGLKFQFTPDKNVLAAK